VTRDELFASIVAAGPGRDDLVYLERSGDAYHWRMVTGAEMPSSATAPDVWMSLTADWPLDEPARLRAFFDDLLAELESMADTADRCRWPIDEPWPHHH
jgi:hypothetical protein